MCVCVYIYIIHTYFYVHRYGRLSAGRSAPPAAKRPSTLENRDRDRDRDSSSSDNNINTYYYYRCRINKHSSRCRLCFESSDPAPLISKLKQIYPAAANKVSVYLSDRVYRCFTLHYTGLPVLPGVTLHARLHKDTHLLRSHVHTR